MSVKRCTHCHRDFPTYKGSPGLPFCSVPCRDGAKNSRRAKAKYVPEDPKAVMREYRQHLKLIHQRTVPRDWNRDAICSICERYEARYAQALADLKDADLPKPVKTPRAKRPYNPMLGPTKSEYEVLYPGVFEEKAPPKKKRVSKDGKR